MKKLIDNLKTARKEILELIRLFPEDKRENILFDKWSLKSLVSHLSGWAQYQIETLKKFKSNTKLALPKNLKNTINIDLVNEKALLSWNEVHREFAELSQKLVEEYEKIPNQEWSKKIYAEEDTTPVEFINFEIVHYHKTHGPQIKRILDKLNC